MSLYKRNDVWWIYLVSPNGKKIRRTTKTADKAKAQKIHDLLKAEIIKSPDSLLKGDQLWRDASKLDLPPIIQSIFYLVVGVDYLERIIGVNYDQITLQAGSDYP